MSDRPRAIFFGTPEFSVPIAAATARVTELVAVVTQPDAPTGRGQKLQPSPLKRWANEHHLAVLEPERMRDPRWLAAIRELRPDVAILAAYGKILPAELLTIPRHGFLNIHPSLLPRHRGPSPVAGALLAGDEQTGVSLMLLDDEMDHGPIIAQVSTEIEPHENRSDLEARLAQLGAELLTSSIVPYLAGRLIAKPQDHDQATYTSLLKREDGTIDWHQPADIVARRIRAMFPWPGSRTSWSGHDLKVLSGVADNQPTSDRPGTVANIDHQPAVVCGRGSLVLKMVQLDGGKPMPASDFARGHRDFIGSHFD